MKVLTFGEIMLRLKAPGHERFFQSPMLEATFGGGEANVAVSLANYGMDAEFLTVLPQNDIADACIPDTLPVCLFPGKHLEDQKVHARPDYRRCHAESLGVRELASYFGSFPFKGNERRFLVAPEYNAEVVLILFAFRTQIQEATSCNCNSTGDC